MMKKYLLNPVKHLIHKNYYTARAYYEAKLYCSKLLHSLSSKNQKKAIVYQMGKVGSSTVSRTLKSLEMDVYHVHSLTHKGIEKTENTFKTNFPRTQTIADHLLESKYLRNQLDKGLESKNKWKVVTLVREPIARNISSFFQTLEFVRGYDYKNKIQYMKIEDITEELRELFLEDYQGHETPLTWIDNELKPALDIDVFSQEFPKSKGYEIYEAKSTDLLVLRLENLNECASDAFKEFLGISEFTLVEANVGSDKEYRTIYQSFLNSIVLPESYLDKMYTSKYARHFYSEEEIEVFKAKWRRNNLTFVV